MEGTCWMMKGEVIRAKLTVAMALEIQKRRLISKISDRVTKT